jgi:hypothetical protein
MQEVVLAAGFRMSYNAEMTWHRGRAGDLWRAEHTWRPTNCGGPCKIV